MVRKWPKMVRKWPSKMVGNELKMVVNGRNLLKIAENYGKWLTMTKRWPKWTEKSQRGHVNGPNISENCRKQTEIGINGRKWPKMAEHDQTITYMRRKWKWSSNARIWSHCDRNCTDNGQIDRKWTENGPKMTETGRILAAIVQKISQIGRK